MSLSVLVFLCGELHFRLRTSVLWFFHPRNSLSLRSLLATCLWSNARFGIDCYCVYNKSTCRIAVVNYFLNIITTLSVFGAFAIPSLLSVDQLVQLWRLQGTLCSPLGDGLLLCSSAAQNLWGALGILNFAASHLDSWHWCSHGCHLCRGLRLRWWAVHSLQQVVLSSRVCRWEVGARWETVCRCEHWKCGGFLVYAFVLFDPASVMTTQRKGACLWGVDFLLHRYLCIALSHYTSGELALVPTVMVFSTNLEVTCTFVVRISWRWFQNWLVSSAIQMHDLPPCSSALFDWCLGKNICTPGPLLTSLLALLLEFCTPGPAFEYQLGFLGLIIELVTNHGIHAEAIWYYTPALMGRFCYSICTAPSSSWGR